MAFRRKSNSVTNTTVVTGNGQTVVSGRSGGRSGAGKPNRRGASSTTGSATSISIVSGRGNTVITDASTGDVNQRN